VLPLKLTYNIARNRRDVRRYGGIRKLVRLLKAKPGSKEEEAVAISGALALATCSKSCKLIFFNCKVLTINSKK
jgi:hypothetical protein